jgi:siderophore synthetase component
MSFSAEDATLQSLLNGFLREVDAGLYVQTKDCCTVEINLRHCQAALRVEVNYQSRTGPHGFGAAQVRFDGARAWQSASTVQVISLLVQECFTRNPVNDPEKLPEFMRAVFDSNAQINKVMRRKECRKPVQTFLDAEQSLAFGHWLHPTPKSRDGMADWHLNTYAPEFGGAFQLAFFAAHKSIVRSGSAGVAVDKLLHDLPDMRRDIALGDDECLVPTHPLQADALLLDDDIKALFQSGKLRFLGQMGGKFAATSSVRTLYSADSPWMLKFSIPVRLTNSLRVTKNSELEVGVAMARLLKELSFNRDTPQFQIINDPAYLTIDIPGRTESGFELVVRENPFAHGHDQGVFNIAALTADPMPWETSLLARTVIKAARAKSVAVPDMAQTWFASYLACCFDPLMDLYDTQGIALEAHQQNALVRLEGGLPTVGYFRDNQSYLVTHQALPRLARIVPELSDFAVLAYDVLHINTRLAYYLILNQIFAVLWRLGKDGLVHEQILLEQMVVHLQQLRTELSGPAAEFITYLLTSPTLETKANLLTRVQNIDELEQKEQEGLFVEMANPIAATAMAMTAASKAIQEHIDVPA